MGDDMTFVDYLIACDFAILTVVFAVWGVTLWRHRNVNPWRRPFRMALAFLFGSLTLFFGWAGSFWMRRLWDFDDRIHAVILTMAAVTGVIAFRVWWHGPRRE